MMTKNGYGFSSKVIDVTDDENQDANKETPNKVPGWFPRPEGERVRYLVDKDDGSAVSLIQKMLDSRPGGVILVTKFEMEAYSRIRKIEV